MAVYASVLLDGASEEYWVAHSDWRAFLDAHPGPDPYRKARNIPGWSSPNYPGPKRGEAVWTPGGIFHAGEADRCDHCGEAAAHIDVGFSPALHEMKHLCGGTWRPLVDGA